MAGDIVQVRGAKRADDRAGSEHAAISIFGPTLPEAARVHSPVGPHPGRGRDQPRPLGRRGCRGTPALPRHHGDDPRDRTRWSRGRYRNRGRDVGGELAAEPHLLAVRRGAGHRRAVRVAGRACRSLPELQDRRSRRIRAWRARGPHVDAHFLPGVRVHHDRWDRSHHGARQGAGAPPPRCLLLRELRGRLRRQGGDLRARDLGAPRAAAPRRGTVPVGAARHRRGVTRLHPFTLLAIAGALPALAWLLPAPVGGLATAVVALGLTLTGGARLTRTAVLTAAPFWLFLLLLHDLPTSIAIGLRVTTMVASFVWVVGALPPPRLVEAMVAAGWSASVAYVFAATLAAAPVLRARARRIADAQRCRGLSARGGLAHRLRALWALALPLILSSLHEVDERALALETRRLVPGARRTPLSPPPDRGAERLARWGLVAACAAALGWRLR
ncbi:MAG: hypothetical protein DMD33_07120 [Gemmatimonadetes bacterium]|nr:MAG: hypothetical protein DMD33_07120 [Gemmatimonadota bacterium]